MKKLFTFLICAVCAVMVAQASSAQGVKSTSESSNDVALYPIIRTINVSFGGGAFPGWNVITSFQANTKIDNLRDVEGNITAASIKIVDRFGGQNNNGPSSSPVTDLDLPLTVVKENFFGNVGAFGDGVFPEATVLISSLDPTKEYDFTMYAGRLGANDNRETYFKFIGLTEDEAIVYLDASNNSTNYVTATGVQPDAEGNVTVKVGPGPNNTNGSKFYHLATMSITPKDVAAVETVPFTNPIKLSFGNATVTPGWNVLWSWFENAQATNLRDINGDFTPVSVTVVDRFTEINFQGATETTTALEMPAEVSSSSFYGNTSAWIGLIEPTGAVKFSNLEPEKAYDFEIFGSRAGVGDNRDTEYKLSGLNAADTIVYLDASNNTTNTVKALGIKSDANGEIRLDVQAGPNNNNGTTKFYYLGALSIVPSAITSISEKRNEEFKVYPNPFKDYVNISSKSDINSLKIFSIDGKEVISQSNLKQNTVNQISTKHLDSGSYVIMVDGQRTILIK